PFDPLRALDRLGAALPFLLRLFLEGRNLAEKGLRVHAGDVIKGAIMAVVNEGFEPESSPSTENGYFPKLRQRGGRAADPGGSGTARRARSRSRRRTRPES